MPLLVLVLMYGEYNAVVKLITQEETLLFPYYYYFSFSL